MQPIAVLSGISSAPFSFQSHELARMPRIPKITLDLEVDQPRNKDRLTLDLWKGFSAIISITTSGTADIPQPEFGEWYYTIPAYHDRSTRNSRWDIGNGRFGWKVHLARALSRKLMVITDLDGVEVPIKEPVDLSPWTNSFINLDEASGDRTVHDIFSADPELLRQLRHKLIPGSDYLLLFAATTYPINFLRRQRWSANSNSQSHEGDHHRQDSQDGDEDDGGDSQADAGDTDKSNGGELIDDPQDNGNNTREDDEPSQNNTYQQEKQCMQEIECAKTVIRFRVNAGVPIPQFTMSLSASPFFCDRSGKDPFALTQVTTSLAERPIRLALTNVRDRGDTCYTKLIIEWAFNNFPNMIATSDPYIETWRHHENIWMDDFRCNMPSTIEVIPGAYRRRLDKQNEPIPIDTLISRMPHQNPNRAARNVLCIVLCPGDQLVHRYVINQKYLDALKPNFTYQIRVKDQRCTLWEYVDDTDIGNNKAVTMNGRLDNGPIRLEHVSDELALMFERIFENAKSKPLFRLPYELRKEVYGHLRFNRSASFVRFKTSVSPNENDKAREESKKAMIQRRGSEGEANRFFDPSRYYA